MAITDICSKCGLDGLHCSCDQFHPNIPLPRLNQKINYQELIVKIIENHNGLKSSELSLGIMSLINPHRFENEDFLNALEGLIEDKIIVQFMYTNKSGTKLMYFPKGTIFLIGK